MIVVLWLRSYPLKHVEEWTNFQGRWQKLSFAVGAIDGTSMEIYRPGIQPQMRVKLCFNNRYQISPVSQYTSKRKININLHQVFDIYQLSQQFGYHSTWLLSIVVHSSSNNIHTLQDTLKIRRYWFRDQIQCKILVYRPHKM